MTQRPSPLLTISVVEPEKNYAAVLIIGGRVFRCNVECKVSPVATAMPVPKTPAELREMFPITVKRTLETIPLDDDEYGFFYQSVVAQLSILHESGEDEMTGPLEDLDQMWVDVLSRPKFGCIF